MPFQRRGTSWPIPPHFRQGIHARSGVLGFVMNLKGVRYCMNQAVNDCATTSSEVEQSVSQEINTNNLQGTIRAATSGRVTASHPNSEVKLPRVSVVLRWGTTREGDMLHVFIDAAYLLFLVYSHIFFFPFLYDWSEIPTSFLSTHTTADAQPFRTECGPFLSTRAVDPLTLCALDERLYLLPAPHALDSKLVVKGFAAQIEAAPPRACGAAPHVPDELAMGRVEQLHGCACDARAPALWK